MSLRTRHSDVSLRSGAAHMAAAGKLCRMRSGWQALPYA